MLLGEGWTYSSSSSLSSLGRATSSSSCFLLRLDMAIFELRRSQLGRHSGRESVFSAFRWENNRVRWRGEERGRGKG